MNKQTSRNISMIYLVSFIVLVIVVGYFLTDTGDGGMTIPTHFRWLIMVILILLLLMVLGYLITGRLAGVLIDSRNKVSLSRFQLTTWTILVMSAFLTIGLSRTKPGYLNPITDAQTEACMEEMQNSEQDVADITAADTSESDDQATDTQQTKPLDADTVDTSTEDDINSDLILNEECTPQPLKIKFPEELIAALGISSASLAGSSLLKSSKKKQDKPKNTIVLLNNIEHELQDNSNRSEIAFEKTNQEISDYQEEQVRIEIELAEAKENLEMALTDEEKAEAKVILAKYTLAQNENKARQEALSLDYEEHKAARDEAEIELKMFINGKNRGAGLLHRNDSVFQASWADMFRGEEITNFNTIEISKFQMFIFTLVVIATYSLMIYSLLQNDIALKNPLGFDFPNFSSSLNYLLLISHAGYLTSKYSHSA